MMDHVIRVGGQQAAHACIVALASRPSRPLTSQVVRLTLHAIYGDIAMPPKTTLSRAVLVAKHLPGEILLACSQGKIKVYNAWAILKLRPAHRDKPTDKFVLRCLKAEKPQLALERLLESVHPNWRGFIDDLGIKKKRHPDWIGTAPQDRKRRSPARKTVVSS